METSPPSSRCAVPELPAELHNRIYEASMSYEQDGMVEVDLFDAKPPDKALLLTCRQIHAEAKGIYKIQHCQFWRNSRFIIEPMALHWNEIAKARLQSIADADLQAITFRGLPCHFCFHCWMSSYEDIVVQQKCDCTALGARTYLSHYGLTRYGYLTQ